MGRHHTHRHRRVWHRDHRRVLGVARRVDMDTEPLQTVHDAAPHLGRVLADPGREDERVYAAKHGGQRADRLSDGVAEEIDRRSGAWIGRCGARWGGPCDAIWDGRERLVQGLDAFND